MWKKFGNNFCQYFSTIYNYGLIYKSDNLIGINKSYNHYIICVNDSYSMQG